MNLISGAWEAITKRLTKLAPAPDDDFWYRPVGENATTWTGRAVSEQTALQCSTVWGCVLVIAQAIASLPLNVYRRLPNGGKELATEHPLYTLLHDAASKEQSSFEFWETSLAHLLLWGNCYARQEYDSRRNVEALILLPPDRMRVERDRETQLRTYNFRHASGQEETLFEDTILHIPGLGYDGLKGYSPIQMQRQAIGLALAGEEYQARFFSNNARPGSYISHPGVLGDKARKNLLESWEDLHRGLSGAHKVGVLEEGMKFETVGVPQKDMEFLALRKFQVEEIARIFRVPPHMVQSLERSTNNNIEHQAIDFVTHTVRPWAVRIERRLNKPGVLFGEREGGTYFAEFSLDALLRGDSASRAAYYAVMHANALMNANEIRSKENMNPYEGGEEYFVQGAMVPVSRMLAAPAPEPAEPLAALIPDTEEVTIS